MMIFGIITTFTIHFATINTMDSKKSNKYIESFTIHFATINTEDDVLKAGITSAFTIHFATINTIYKFIHVCSHKVIYNTLCYY